LPDASTFPWSRAGTVGRQPRAALLHQDQTNQSPQGLPGAGLGGRTATASAGADPARPRDAEAAARGAAVRRLARLPPGGRGRSAQRRRPASACGEAGRCQLLRSWSCPATWRCSSAHSDSSPASRSALTGANAAAACRGKNAPRARASLTPSVYSKIRSPSAKLSRSGSGRGPRCCSGGSYASLSRTPPTFHSEEPLYLVHHLLPDRRRVPG
jgi:hypothetical protein